MPKFLYTVLIAAVVSWGLFINQFLNTSTEGVGDVALFLVNLFISLSFTFSIILYFFFYKKAPSFTNLKFVYRKSLKWSLYFYYGILVLIFLKATTLLNIINLILFLVLYYFLFKILRRRV
jgi:hypothetical protein